MSLKVLIGRRTPPRQSPKTKKPRHAGLCCLAETESANIASKYVRRKRKIYVCHCFIWKYSSTPYNPFRRKPIRHGILDGIPDEALPMATITDTKARNIQPADPAIPHGNITGLALHPSSTKGHGKWVLRYVSPVTGKRRNAGLGSYPEVTIAEAGKRASAMRLELGDGRDPLVHRFRKSFTFQPFGSRSSSIGSERVGHSSRRCL